MPTTTTAEGVNMSDKKKQSKPGKAKKESRKKKEEEEWGFKEEEEARLIAEKEEQERLEREQKEEEERLRLELKDRERREDELNELRLILEEKQKDVNMWEAAAREKAEWDRYMICDGSPNPAVQPEINTFITLWKEDPQVDIQTILQQFTLALRLTDELELLLSEETEPGIIQVYQDTLQSLQSLIHAKQQMATEEILKSATTCSDIETGNMQMIVRDDNITLCLWANIKKNPKFKGYHFQGAGLSFELPKPLTLSDISVRILHTRYDHLSHLSLRTQAQNKSPAAEEEAEADAETLSETAKALEDGGMKGEDEGRKSVQQGKDDLRSLKSSEGKKSRVSVRSAKEGEKSSSLKLHEEPEDHSESIVEGVTSSGEAEDDTDTEPTVVLPATDSTELHIVDLHRYTPLGGVYYFDVFHLPPQSLTLNGWEMTEILVTGLQNFPYPSEQPHSSVSGQLEDSGTQSYPPVGVTVILPESVIFMQEPQVARWDPVGQHWRTDCITETSYNSEERSMSFKMDTFYAFTLLQETHVNMPFQHWELRPQGQDSVTLTITAALCEVRITVQGNQCVLQMDQAPGLNHILGKWMSLPALQTAMRRAGVNVFVNEYSDKYVTVSAKDPLIEHAAYEQMALVASAFVFSRSQWNAQCRQEHLVLQACEHLEAEPVPEEAWSLYLLTAQRSQRLKMTETSDGFSPELAEETEFHSTFLHMLRDIVSPEGRGKLNNTPYLFVDTVQKLLRATRLFTYS
ncbi:dynein axonemal intermediate chain 7 isoform X1 [Ictalurus furcatus]|uniref:dynein axonemal intermediate chain 7 isoform X1 n=2 Tax=Ictalurus furcatus TaxID=66913 RepID=UPI00234FBB81|nr:dynein axonemal intermediate chain 7 isoform X1 [Ictalurus furcatus]